MILDAFLQALQYFWDLPFIAAILGGAIAGLIIGIVPGIGALAGLALFLPFVFTLAPKTALPFMITLSAVSFTGGAITSILLNIPGEETTAATLIDGFPMTQKGEGGRALGAALTSSGLGGIVSVLLALGMVPLVLPMVFAIQSADMVFIILLGIAFIAVLARNAMIKGLISGGLGIMLSLVGFQMKTCLSRYTFGTDYLYEGFALVPLVIGLFALPEMIALFPKGGSIAQTGVAIKEMGQVLEGAKDVFRHWGLWLRCTIVGYIIGVLPGIGATAAMFVAYGQAKQTSKHPERFGTGIVEGVIAPQSAINAEVGGGLLTTLALGIPGNAVGALLLGAMLILGLTPGPEMMTKHLDLSFALLLTVAFSNLLASAFCLSAAPLLARVAFVPIRILCPLVVVAASVGTFVYRGEILDVIVAFFFAGLGLAMRRFGYNAPALLLAFIMGNLFEKYLFIAIGVSGLLFFVRPISLTLIVIIIGVLAHEPVRKMLSRWSRKGGNAV